MPDLDRKSLGIGRRPALIVVDMMNGFTDPASPLGSNSDAVVEANQQLLAAFRAASLPVFFSAVVYNDEEQARVFRDRVPALNILKSGSHWVEIDSRLNPQPGERIVEKQWVSAFFGTELGNWLMEQSVDSLVVTGLTTSGCVRGTVVDGLQYNYKVVVPREATGDRNLDAHEANLFDLNAKYADVTDLQDVLDHVTGLSKTREANIGVHGIIASLYVNNVVY
jgi:maleamate amidohydrolase